MAMTTCRECGKEVSTEAKTCPHCGAGRPARRSHRWPAIVALVFLVGLVAVMLANRDSTTTTAAPVATDSVAAFVGAAGGYLVTANKEGHAVAAASAGLQDGSTTLTDVQQAISNARDVENVAYVEDYEAHRGPRVPAAFALDTARLQETHRLFQDATGEMLRYWDDQNTEHIVSGTRTFRRAVLVMNKAVADIDRTARALSAAQKRAR